MIMSIFPYLYTLGIAILCTFAIYYIHGHFYDCLIIQLSIIFLYICSVCLLANLEMPFQQHNYIVFFLILINQTWRGGGVTRKGYLSIIFT